MPQHRSGPVRNEEARVAILDATAELFERRGYDHLTMEGIAAQAGVGKQTIYRWWSSKAELVSDCLLEGRILPDRLSPPDTGDIRRDLVAWLTEVFGFLSEPSGQGLMRSLVAAAVENVDIGVHLRQSLGANSSPAARLTAAVEAGQVPANAPLEEMSEALIGAVVLRALSRIPTDPETAARLVGVVLPA